MTAKEKLLKDDVAEQIETESKGRKAYKEFLQERFTPEQIEDAQQAERTAKAMAQQAEKTAQGMAQFAKLLKESMNGNMEQVLEKFNNYAKKYADIIEAAERVQQELADLEPFIQAELDDYAAKHPNANKISFDDLLGQIDIIGKPYTKLSRDVLEAARKRREKSEKGKEAVKKAQQKEAEAERAGAIRTIGERLLIPTKGNYEKAFITSGSPAITAGLFRIVGPDGKPSKDGTGTRQAALDINTPLVLALAKCAAINLSVGGGDVYTISTADIIKELGLDLHKYKPKKDGDEAETRKEIEEANKNAVARAEYIISNFKKFEDVRGTLPTSNKVYNLLTWQNYDPDTEFMDITTPYITQLLRENIKIAQTMKKNKEGTYIWRCDLLHSTAVAERNQAAVEMATRILQGVQQRGCKPEPEMKQNRRKRYIDKDIVAYHISCQQLIDDCPQLRAKLKAQKTKSNQTKVLQRSLKVMYGILKNKSDLFAYYADLKIKEVLPSMTNIYDEIVITHHGLNPDYVKPLMLLELDEEPQEVQEMAAIDSAGEVESTS